MPQEFFSNNYQTTLNGTINNSQTSIVVASNAGFPSNAQFRIIIDSEIMTVTAGQAGLTWTVTRNSETTFGGSGAASHNSGATVTMILTAGGLTNAIALPVAGASWGAGVLLTLASVANNYGLSINGPSGAGTSLGLFVNAGTNSSDYSARFQTQALVDILRLRGDGQSFFNGAVSVPPTAGASLPTTNYGTLAVKVDDQSVTTQSSVTLTIPAGGLYRSLWVEIEARSDQAGSQALLMQLNADTGTNYDSNGFQDTNSTLAGIAPTIAGTSCRIGQAVASGSAAGAIAATSLRIVNADSTTMRKHYTYNTGLFATDAAGSAQFEAGMGQWRNTTNAITSIKIFPAAGNITGRARAYGAP